MDTVASITITRQSGYQFLVDFAPGMAQLVADEPPPLGQGSGPTPSHVLLASVANCLVASLTFALQKFKQDPGPLTATATATFERNASNRLRIQHIAVDIKLGVPWAELSRLDRALAQFEEFCTVSMSVRQGIDIGISVSDPAGVRLR
jgi:uncharacterized OsmC-like protein